MLPSRLSPQNRGGRNDMQQFAPTHGFNWIKSERLGPRTFTLSARGEDPQGFSSALMREVECGWTAWSYVIFHPVFPRMLG